MYPCHLSNSVPVKKNPFLGEERLWFANTPTEGGSGEKSEFVPLVEQIKNVVPGRQGKPEELMDRHEHWISSLAPYNEIQVHINYLTDLRKRLSDPKLIETPEFKERIRNLLRTEYQKMEKIIGVLPNVDNSLKDSVLKNVKSQINTNRLGAVRDVDRLTAALLKQRKKSLEDLGKTLKEDLTERVVNLREKWEKNPPKGYEDYQEGWLDYCTEMVDILEKFDIAALDDGKKDSPLGHKLLQEAEVWWDKVSHMEDSYVDFTRQDTSKFTVENAQREYELLKQKKDKILSPEVVQKFKEAADQVIAKGKETEAVILAKQKEWAHDHSRQQDLEILDASLAQLREKMKELNEKKNIKEMVDTAFTSEKEVTRFQVPNEAGYLSVPEGIEGQIRVLGQLPMSTPGRRQVIRTLLESMKGLEDNIKNYQTFADVTLTQALIDLDLFQKGIDTNTNQKKRELMFINPFSTLSHVWHSYTEAVKGNVETNDKRGAGFFQRDATKIFANMPKIPVVSNLSVIKSLTELSANGAIEAEHAEHHRVGEYEKNYEGVPPDHLSHMAEEASDEWELQGCLKVLAKHGRINWYAPWLFKSLNRYQRIIHLPEDRHWHMRNISKSNELMRQAFVYIYRDEDVYRNLRNSNLSSYESKMGEYSKQWGPIAAEDGALKRKAEEILSIYNNDHHAGKHNSKANPIEFESIIRYAVEQGKMKMEDRLNLLVRGIACGLLSFDRGVNATDKNNTYPPFDYFDTGTSRGGKPTYDDILEWATYAEDPATWDYFMHKADGVMNNKAVNERLLKTMTQGSHRLDHDDAAGIAGYLTMDISRDLLKQKTQGGYGMPVTGLKSLITGNDFWLCMFAEQYNKRSPETNKNEMIRFASQFIMLEGIMNERVFKESQDYYRLKEGPDRTDPPRFPRGGYGKVFQVKETKANGKKYNPNAGAAEILSDVSEKLMMLDFGEEQLIHKLLSGQIKTNADAEVIASRLESKTQMFEGAPPKTINDLYAALPKYFKYALDKHPENMETMVAAIYSEHGRHTDSIDQTIEPKLAHIREAARQRGLTGEEPEHHGGHDEGHGHGGHGHGGDHGGGHGHEEHGHGEHGHEGEHPTEGHGAPANNSFHYDDQSDASHGSTHGQHKAAA